MTRLIVLRGKKSLSCHYCVACRLQEEQEDKERGERGGVGGGTNPHSETVLDREERRRTNGPSRPEFAALRETKT